MIRSTYEHDHPERARMASIIGGACSGRSLDTDAADIRDLIRYDQRIMERFLQFLIIANDKGVLKNLGPERGCRMAPREIVYQIYTSWLYRNEATWVDEWKKWSADV